ncbi:hypothetical protein SCHPADRAFT_883718 [Schizopora paradoxa]|uniref:Uncharacterized protein n=1 Tax=Schizopora paradoxa TaxID=27342 RepID=A0A0H2R1D8_9AGAM|nr:hypothetical protein SCHPADRAFT_883718 [Schizopora paradoxa]
MLQRTLRASRSRFTSVSVPLLRINEDDVEADRGAAGRGRETVESTGYSSPSPPLPSRRYRPGRLKRRGTQGFIPLGGTFAVLLALFLSLLFILTISIAFANANESLYFKNTLDKTAKIDPGVVLIGEGVDVDIDELETAVDIRWTIAGCGEGYVLSGSPPLHGSTSCGVLAFPITIDIEQDSDENNDDIEFDPSKIPREPITNRLLMIQTLMQFDSEHKVDVHTARFYPFDTYLLTTSLRVEAENQTDDDGPEIPLRISATPLIQYTSSFALSTTVRQGQVVDDDDDDFVGNSLGNSTLNRNRTVPVHHLEVLLSRPGPARAYAMLVFGINWLLAHCAVGAVVLAKKHKLHRGGREEVLLEAVKYAAVVFGILLAIPQLRTMMPDAPEFHGALIDTIGFFPQMSMAGISLVLLLLLTASRLLDAPPRRRTSSSSSGRLSSSFIQAISTPKVLQKPTSYIDDCDSVTIVEHKEAPCCDKDPGWKRDSQEYARFKNALPLPSPWEPKVANFAHKLY